MHSYIQTYTEKMGRQVSTVAGLIATPPAVCQDSPFFIPYPALKVKTELAHGIALPKNTPAGALHIPVYCPLFTIPGLEY